MNSVTPQASWLSAQPLQVIDMHVRTIYFKRSRPMHAFAVCILMLASVLHQAQATTIEYTLSRLGADRWRYTYTVTNELSRAPIQEFTIMFPAADFADLTVESSPASWDSLKLSRDNHLYADGFFDSMAWSFGIGPGVRLGGFAASFDYLMAGIPGAQAYNIVDPVTFAVLDSGFSTPMSTVPEMSTFVMWWIGAIALGATRAVRRGLSLRRASVAGRVQ